MFEALRRTGIPAEAIYVSYNKGNPATVVRTQGKQFAISLGITVEDPEDEYLRAYHAASSLWNETMTNAERIALYHEEIAHEDLVDLIWTLRRKGFYLSEVSRVLGES